MTAETTASGQNCHKVRSATEKIFPSFPQINYNNTPAKLGYDAPFVNWNIFQQQEMSEVSEHRI